MTNEKNTEPQLAELKAALEAEKKAHEATKKALTDLEAAHSKTKDEFDSFKIEAEARLMKERARNPKKRVEVKHHGKTYLFKHPKVNMGGKIVSAEVAAENEQYIASLLAIKGQNILVEDK